MKSRLIKIIVTGSNGMVGHAIQRLAEDMDKAIELLDDKTRNKIIERKILYKFIFLDKKSLNLMNKEKVRSVLSVQKPDVVLHLAAKVGGLFDNQKNNHDFYFENLAMSQNLLEACHKEGIKHTFSFLSTCIYPNNTALLPYKEHNLHNGEPHASNYGYAFAKRQHEVMCRLYNSLGDKHVCLIPNNLYGPNDNFNIERAHVIPAIIQKTYNAILSNEKLTLPGSGLAHREFTYVDDIAKQTLAYILYCLFSDAEDKPKVINIGNNEEIKILDVMTLVYKSFIDEGIKVRFDYNNVFSKSRFDSTFDGIFRKPSSLDLLHSTLPKTKQTTPMNVGIKETVSWFLKEQTK